MQSYSTFLEKQKNPEKIHYLYENLNMSTMRSFMISAVAVAALMMPLSCKQADNTLTSKEKAEGWELLFDGKTLDGWRDFAGTQLTGPWVVENGTIRAEGEGSDASGYIVTDKEYANFDLVWDWKISRGGNSGMLYHVVENRAFPVPYVTGPEYQLIDDENWEEVNGFALEDWQRCAVDYAMYVPDFAKRKLKPAGEWNTSRIIFDRSPSSSMHGVPTGMPARIPASGRTLRSTACPPADIYAFRTTAIPHGSRT